MNLTMNIAQSLGAKLTLICMICLVLVAVVAASINQVLVRDTRDRMLDLSEKLAEEKGRQLAGQYMDIWNEARRVALSKSNPTRAQSGPLRVKIKRGDEVLQAYMVEEGLDGSKILVRGYRDDQDQRMILGEGESLESEIRDQDDGLRLVLENASEKTNLRTISVDEVGHPGLKLYYELLDTETLPRIEEAGSQITKLVATMTGLLCAALVLSFLVVWGLFRGQMRLFRENEKLNRMAYVGTLASGLAHEIRNPLNAMSVNLGVVEEDLQEPRADSPGRVGKIVRHLQSEVRQLDGVVTNFMAYAMPGARARERLLISEPASEALGALEEDIERLKVKTNLELGDELMIEGDPVGLRQVFQNLALNAIEAMRDSERRHLTVRGWRENGKMHVICQDTGAGISPQNMARIFEAFHSGKPGGSGFGLPIAKRIVESHGGRIWAESNPGQGATFHMEFPLPSRRARR